MVPQVRYSYICEHNNTTPCEHNNMTPCDGPASKI